MQITPKKRKNRVEGANGAFGNSALASLMVEAVVFTQILPPRAYSSSLPPCKKVGPVSSRCLTLQEKSQSLHFYRDSPVL